MRHGFILFLAALALTSPIPAGAQSGLHFEEVAPRAVRVDGQLREWPRDALRQLGRGRDGAMQYALGYDEEGIYLAADVSDGELVRNARPGPSDDGVRLDFFVPGRRDPISVFVLPAAPGKAASGAYLGTESRPQKAIAGAKVVEAITSEGYVVEAFIPFAGIRGLSDFPRARARIALVDADRGKPTRRIVSSEGMPPIITGSGGELGVFTEFLSRVGAVAPTLDLRADVLGGNRKERVAIARGTVFVGGGDHGDGSGYDALPLGRIDESHESTLAELTGDGKADLFLRITSAEGRGKVSEAVVVTFGTGKPRVALRVPYALESREGRVENVARLEPRPKRGPKLVAVRAGRAEGFDSDSLTQDEDDLSLILPFGPIAARLYDLTGGRARIFSVEKNRDYRPPSARSSAPAERADAPPTMDRLIEAARDQLGLPKSAPRRFEHETNVAGDATPERLVIIDRTVIVVGPKFRGGNSYLQLELGVDSPGRIRRVHSVDLDGDGRDEVIFRINQDLGQGVSRCVLLIHRLSERGAELIHAREIARYYDGASVLNTYRVVGQGKKRRIVFSPGKAKGFSESNWPFGALEGDSFEPLLLPWRDGEVQKRL